MRYAALNVPPFGQIPFKIVEVAVFNEYCAALNVPWFGAAGGTGHGDTTYTIQTIINPRVTMVAKHRLQENYKIKTYSFLWGNVVDLRTM